MIRPFTLVCILLACGSGLYLYQAKHRVQMLDHEIEKTVRDTNERRERFACCTPSGRCKTIRSACKSWQISFLALKTVTPGQFTTWPNWTIACPPCRHPRPQVPRPCQPRHRPPIRRRPEEPKPVPVAASEPPPPAPPAPVAPKPAPVMAAASPPPRPPEQEHEHETERDGSRLRRRLIR